MTTVYGAYEWKFNHAAWNAALLSVPRSEWRVLAEIMDVQVATLYAWSVKKGAKNADEPRIANLLKVCNYLELDPASMFHLVKIGA